MERACGTNFVAEVPAAFALKLPKAAIVSLKRKNEEQAIVPIVKIPFVSSVVKFFPAPKAPIKKASNGGLSKYYI